MYSLDELRQRKILDWALHGQLRIQTSKAHVWLMDSSFKTVTEERLRRGKWFVVRQYQAI